MADARGSAVERAQYWVVPVVRGALALVPSIVITFLQIHSTALGQSVFGVWALVAGAVVGALTLRTVDDRVTRSLFATQGALTAAAGLLALIVTPNLGFLVVLLSSWAAITGILEIFAGLRARGRSQAARDWLIVGGATALAAIAFLVFPFDPVSIVGLLGAYLVVIGVLLEIGGFSLKWAGRAAVAGPEASRSEQS
ncbi:hypothetical protein GE115_03925 [Agromyces sp. CFH 90414]|uniref:HdeD family acid-resistance protein n=1 Tax=Agromyces agglutinans TaxID=2662258 RepID=A0A6I2F386_9MICO|nr:hypothetical protein [Agromyces agglutinans]MRG59019.1 hypothetical protein [Agromyces agglutinans]